MVISAGKFHTVGLKSDGTVVAVGWNKKGQCDVSGWRLFQNIETLEAERAEARKRRMAEQKAALEMELSSLKGLFTGKRRREIEAQLAEIDSKLKALN